MIESASPRSEYIGNGSATSFDYTFPVTNKAYLKATLTVIATEVESTLVVDTDYTVNGVGSADDSTWNITYPVSGTAMASTHRLTITPNLPLTQLTNFSNQGGFHPATHEAAFDQATVKIQQIQEELDRAVKVSVGSTTNPDDLISDLETASAAAVAAAATAAAALTGLSTKGDLLTYDTANNRLAVGTDGQVLTADSAQTKGVKWATPAATPTFASLSPLTTEGDTLYRNATVNTRLAKGTALQAYRMNAAATAPEWYTSTAGGDYVFFRDQKPTGTNAGTATAGAWNTRVLNTEVSDTAGLASVASNQITLAAGTYRVWARAPAYFQTAHKLRLRNITDSTTIINGATGGNVAAACETTLWGKFTLASTKVLELQHWINVTAGTYDLGYTTTNSGDIEVYAEIIFIKE